MSTIFTLLKAACLIPFWAAILAFIPSVIYVIIEESKRENQPNEDDYSENVFIIRREPYLRKVEKSLLQTIGVIYLVCLSISAATYLVNFLIEQNTHFKPLDVFSSFSIILFWIAILTYIPVAFTFIIKQPHLYRRRYKHDIDRLRVIFYVYGFAIMNFSFIYAYLWLKERGLVIEITQLLFALGIVAACSLAVSYVPIVLYMISREIQKKREAVSLNVVFAIYSLSFLIFSGACVLIWVSGHVPR